MKIQSKRYFITGTDTDVGKTYVTEQLLYNIQKNHKLNVVGFKPVASGAIYSNEENGYRNLDALILQNASTKKWHYSDINPYCFAEATSPHIASHLSYQDNDESNSHTIQFDILSKGLHKLQQQSDVVLIEGAGGWFTPLSSNLLFSDWVQSENLPVILVVSLKLGCINHALLTQSAIKQANLQFSGWILNHQNKEDMAYHQAYRQTLIDLIQAPLLAEIPYRFNVDKTYFNLTPLFSK